MIFAILAQWEVGQSIYTRRGVGRQWLLCFCTALSKCQLPVSSRLVTRAQSPRKGRYSWDADNQNIKTERTNAL
eukprot:2982819-Amphidinium_carterae.1